MDISTKELSKLPYSVEGNVDYFATYPQLKKYPEFADEVINKLPFKFNDVFKYIVLLYSPNTPLLQVADQKERKQTAADLSGVDYKQLYKNKAVTTLLIGYLRMQKNPKFSKLIVWYEAYWNQAQRLLSDETESGERTDKLIANISTLENKIEETISELTNQDTDPDLKDSIIQALEDERLPSEYLKPEAVAKDLAEGKPPIDGYNPYKKREWKK